MDGMTEGQNDRQPKFNIAPTFQSGAIIILKVHRGQKLRYYTVSGQTVLKGLTSTTEKNVCINTPDTDNFPTEISARPRIIFTKVQLMAQFRIFPSSE